MKIIYSDNKIDINDNISIFLAGPTPRSKEIKSWRPEFIEELRKINFKGYVLVPEKSSGTEYDYINQVEWEEEGLNKSTIIVFWVPRNLDNMPGFTTNIEFGEWMKSGKCLLGYPENTPGMRYMEYKSKKYSIPIFNNIIDICKFIENKLNKM
jgi:hypothetical protein